MTQLLGTGSLDMHRVMQDVAVGSALGLGLGILAGGIGAANQSWPGGASPVFAIAGHRLAAAVTVATTVSVAATAALAGIPALSRSFMSIQNPNQNEAHGGNTPQTGENQPNFNELPDSVLARIQRGDHKGRPFGSPRNPRMPTIEEFNPRVRDVRAGDLEAIITHRRHPEFPEQAGPIRQLSNEELVLLRLEDPISGVEAQVGLSLTGGHHRTAEIIRRVRAGRMSPDTIIRVIVHD